MVSYINGGWYEAHAKSNERAYFAELSEAFFSGVYDSLHHRNDYYPFTKVQLQLFDPRGYKLLTDCWSDSNDNQSMYYYNISPRHWYFLAYMFV